MMNCSHIHHLPLLRTFSNVLVDPRLHDSEHGRLLGRGLGRATLGAALGTDRSAGPSENPRRAHAHQRGLAIWLGIVLPLAAGKSRCGD